MLSVDIITSREVGLCEKHLPNVRNLCIMWDFSINLNTLMEYFHYGYELGVDVNCDFLSSQILNTSRSPVLEYEQTSICHVQVLNDWIVSYSAFTEYK